MWYLIAAMVYAGTTSPILYQVVNPTPYESEEACLVDMYANAEKHDRILIQVDTETGPYWKFNNGQFDILTDCVPGKNDNTSS